MSFVPPQPPEPVPTIRELQQETLESEFRIHENRKAIEATWLRYAKRRSAAGDPSELVKLKEFQALWPNPSPSSTVSVLNPWTS